MTAKPENRLLALLPPAEYQRLAPHLQAVPLPFKKTLHRPRSPIDYVYFPGRGVVSSITVMGDGRAIEVATIGSEGMVGLTALVGDTTSPTEMLVQVEGAGVRMRAGAFAEQTRRDDPLRQVLVRYHSAYQVQVSYAVACNGLHVVQKRCCRWLLMTQDRVGSDVLPLTHELLASMLGVRRSSVTEVLHPLQGEGLIRCGRGEITVLDREGLEAASCECYRSVREEFTRLLG